MTSAERWSRPRPRRARPTAPLWAALVLVVCALVGACDPEPGPHGVGGSESHFLTSCESSCPDGLTCLCGLCTRPCEEAESCGDLDTAAVCRPRTVTGECLPRLPETLVGICDLLCEDETQCASLSGDNTCNEGACRPDEWEVPEAVVDVGDGGGDGGGDVGPISEATAECPQIDPPVGDTFYVCDCQPGADADCQVGDDGADGTSPDTPWQSYLRALDGFAELQAGDQLAFCTGGRFAATPSDTAQDWVNSNCSAETPCVLRGYDSPWASGDESRPVIEVVDNAKGFHLSEPIGSVTHQEGYVIQDLALVGGPDATGIVVESDLTDVTLCNLDLSGFAVAIRVVPVVPGDPEAGPVERVVLRSSHIDVGAGIGWDGTCDGCVIEYSTFEGDGLAHVSLFGPPDAETSGMRVSFNELSGCQGDGAFLRTGRQLSDLLIEGNRISADGVTEGCRGISVVSGGADPDAFRNVTIRGNTLIDLGNFPIRVNACADCVVENNVIIDRLGGYGWALQVPSPEHEADDLETTRAVVRNNSILLSSATPMTGIRVGGEGSGHVVVSNAILMLGQGGLGCFDIGGDGSEFLALDYNVCDEPDGGFFSWAPGFQDLAAWQADSGHDAHSQRIDPGYAVVNGPDYDLHAADADSPLVDGGDPALSSPTDLDGDARDAAPDIGAYEN